MIEFIKGANIKNSNSLIEGYKKFNNRIESVVNFDKIMKLILDFINLTNDNSYFSFLEVPCNNEDEIKYQSCLHKDIYYLDNISSNTIKNYLKSYGEILVNDGLISFGVGTDSAEIGKYKYNMVNLYSSKLENYKTLFSQNNILENKQLITPWDIINSSHPGNSILYKDKYGKDIYDIINILKEDGLYKSVTKKE